MTTYIKKPVPVDAFRWAGQQSSEWPQWAQNALAAGLIYPNGTALSVQTAEGIMRCNNGDWLIRAKDGRYWPTDHSYFGSNYDLAPQEAIAAPAEDGEADAAVEG